MYVDMSAVPMTIILYLIGFIVIFLLCRIFIKPIKWALRLILSCVMGTIAMILANKLLFSFGINFSVNPLTSMISGVLGVPGMIMTLILSFVL